MLQELLWKKFLVSGDTMEKVDILSALAEVALERGNQLICLNLF